MDDNEKTVFDQYEEMFDECFPRMLCMCMGEDDIEAIAGGCVKSGVPYTVPDDYVC